MASRSLLDLTPEVRVKASHALELCRERDVEILIYCTFRNVTEQSKLYRNGRGILSIERKATELEEVYGRPDLAGVLMGVGPQYGERIVTWAGPGQSLHNYRSAFDSVPIINGKLQWASNSVEWEVYGSACAEADLEWAGAWSIQKREYPHAQDIGVAWRDLIEEYDHA